MLAQARPTAQQASINTASTACFEAAFATVNKGHSNKHNQWLAQTLSDKWTGSNDKDLVYLENAYIFIQAALLSTLHVFPPHNTTSKLETDIQEIVQHSFSEPLLNRNL